MKNNQLIIFNKCSFRNIFLKILRLFKKKEDYSQDINKVINVDNRCQFLQSISFKQNEKEKILIDRLKRDSTILKNMDLEELKEVNKAIWNWKSYLSKRIEVASSEIKIKRINTNM